MNKKKKFQNTSKTIFWIFNHISFIKCFKLLTEIMGLDEQNVRGKIIILSFYVFFKEKCEYLSKKEEG